VLPGLDLIPPMLAAAGGAPTGPGWAWEFKYDGVRSVVYVSGGQVQALSRNGNDVTGGYPELAELPRLLGDQAAILDGEIVANEAGDRPSFARLQQRMHLRNPSEALVASVPVNFYVFDVLHLDGQNLTELPYATRRDLLTGLRLDGDRVRMPANYTGTDGATMIRAAELGGFEGIVAKRLTAPYRPGKRSADWTKVPLVKTQECLVVGWKPGGGRRTGLVGSLLLGVYDDRDRLVYVGHVGTGFTDKMLRRLENDLRPLARATPPVPDVPREFARHARWVEPCLVGDVAFRNWTPDGRLRHPSWRGLRTDKTVSSVHRAPSSPPPPPQGTVTGAMATTDGRWRVEAVRRGQQQFYRLIYGDSVVDGLAIATVTRLLAEAGVDLADLADVTDRPVDSGSDFTAA
jgi:bifunctional non-homologous end joining protein LigD